MTSRCLINGKSIVTMGWVVADTPRAGKHPEQRESFRAHVEFVILTSSTPAKTARTANALNLPSTSSIRVLKSVHFL